MTSNHIRNIAIIAHVDHGKTTLVDQLLRQSGTLSERGEVKKRVMDSNDLEQERGITILAKNTAITWGDYRINIVDTPGHADFGGEVERILSMVDSVLLLVDAVEGPMPQTRFVTQKAFQWGLKPIVVINKVDRDGARPDWVVDQVFDLFVTLHASDEQLDFPVVYASALNGWATLDVHETTDNTDALLDLIVQSVPAPDVDQDGPFQMQVSALDYSSYVGAIAIGRVTRGQCYTNMPIVSVRADGTHTKGRILQILTYLGLGREEMGSASAGDIIAVTGLTEPRISDTVCDPTQPEPLPALTVDEPTVSMSFLVNDSPFAGQDGKYVTSRQIRERLETELIANVALSVDFSERDRFTVSGRGELHLAILIETMRREGYELAVSRPQVIMKEIDGQMQEPYEEVVFDIEETHQGVIMQTMAERQAQMKNMESDGHGRIRLVYMAPTRGLIGLYSLFLTMTSGTGLIYHVFSHYGPAQSSDIKGRHRGVLISNGAGKATAYSIWNLQSRGELFIDPQTEVYEGMVVGQNTRDNDLVVNVIKGKQLTNVRASGTDDNIILTPPRRFTLEQALSFIEEDELVEVTPVAMRLRKKTLIESDRKRMSREKK